MCLEQDEEHDTIYNRDTNKEEAVYTATNPPEQKKDHKPTPLCSKKTQDPTPSNTHIRVPGQTDAAKYTGPKARTPHNWKLTGNRWMCLQCMKYRYFNTANCENEWHSVCNAKRSQIWDKLLDNDAQTQNNTLCGELVDGRMFLYCTQCYYYMETTGIKLMQLCHRHATNDKERKFAVRIIR